MFKVLVILICLQSIVSQELPCDQSPQELDQSSGRPCEALRRKLSSLDQGLDEIENKLEAFLQEFKVGTSQLNDQLEPDVKQLFSELFQSKASREKPN